MRAAQITYNLTNTNASLATNSNEHNRLMERNDDISQIVTDTVGRLSGQIAAMVAQQLNATKEKNEMLSEHRAQHLGRGSRPTGPTPPEWPTLLQVDRGHYTKGPNIEGSGLARTVRTAGRTLAGSGNGSLRNPATTGIKAAATTIKTTTDRRHHPASHRGSTNQP